ncbi:hypothetical protein BIW11_14200 [Tropilaelaps mercedesae]|uniref:Uncharacterized protein n=1 Tax=Tropilaelaps mercedesae TaxID=418985 RepID=A0A1V9WYV5_9ACAR|nr:hypothetical protein BIW11_14200 [Tropilaelaps mercedesae]
MDQSRRPELRSLILRVRAHRREGSADRQSRPIRTAFGPQAHLFRIREPQWLFNLRRKLSRELERTVEQRLQNSQAVSTAAGTGMGVRTTTPATEVTTMARAQPERKPLQHQKQQQRT